MVIKAILFDLDNTLIDFMTFKQKSCEAAIDAMLAAGLNLKREEALKILLELYGKHGIEEQHIFEKFLNKAKGKVDYRVVAKGVLAYRKAKDAYLKPYPNTIPTLIQLKQKYKLAIISDAPRLNAWMRLVSMNLDDFFDIVITAGDVRKTKVHAAPFKAALNALKLKPEEALMVGDRIQRDVNTAKSLGINTCYARYGDVSFSGGFHKSPSKKGESGADFEIEDIKELLDLSL